MEIQLLRIDDRLIHGQVVVGWVKALNIQRLVVVNDAIANNNMQKTLMEMAVPSGLKVSFFSAAEAALKCRSDAGPEKALLLFASPKDVLSFLDKGVPVTSINIGGMHYCEGKNQVSKTVCVSPEDIQALIELRKKGLELEVRAVPGDTKEPLEKFIPDLKGVQS